MVDFNNEATIGTPSTEVVKILILQRRYDLMESLEKHNRLQNQNQDSDTSTLRARLFTLFMEIQAGLKRRLPTKEYTELLDWMNSEEETDIMQAVYKINEELDKINLTKIDTKKVYDSTRVEKENRMKGL